MAPLPFPLAGSLREEAAADIVSRVFAEECLLFLRLDALHGCLPPNSNALRQLLGRHTDELHGLLNELGAWLNTAGHYALGSPRQLLPPTGQSAAAQMLTAGQVLTLLLQNHECLLYYLQYALALLDLECRDGGACSLLTTLVACHQRMRATAHWFTHTSPGAQWLPPAIASEIP